MINPQQERERWFYQSGLPDRHSSLALWSNRNAFVVWTVGVRLGSYTPLNPGTGLYKDEEYKMVIFFVCILLTSELPFCRLSTYCSHSETNPLQKVLLLHFGVKSLYDFPGHLWGSHCWVTVLAWQGIWKAVTLPPCVSLCLVFGYLYDLREQKHYLHNQGLGSMCC